MYQHCSTLMNPISDCQMGEVASVCQYLLSFSSTVGQSSDTCSIPHHIHTASTINIHYAARNTDKQTHTLINNSTRCDTEKLCASLQQLKCTKCFNMLLSYLFYLKILTHCGRVTQICVYTLQLCKMDDTNLRF